MRYQFRSDLSSLANIVVNKRVQYCSYVLSEVKTAFPRCKIDEQEYIAQLNLILDAVVSDLFEDSNFNIIQALIFYTKKTPRIFYKTQTKYIIHGIHILRNVLIAEVDQNTLLVNWLIEKFSLIVNILNNDTIKEAKLWEFFGHAIPYVALFGIIILHYFKLEYWYNYAIYCVMLGFFTTTVMWWWWVVAKIIVLSMSFKNIKHSFVEIKQDLDNVKKLF